MIVVNCRSAPSLPPFCGNDCLCASNKESPRLCASTGTTADVFPLRDGSIIRDERGVSSSTDAYSGLISLPSPLFSSSLEAKSATNPIDLFSFEPLSASFAAPGDDSIAFPEKKRKKVKFLCTIVRQQRSSYRCGEMTAQRLRRGLQARGLSFMHDSRAH